MPKRVIGEGKCVGTVAGLFQIHRHARPRKMGEGETDYSIRDDEFDVYYVNPRNAEGPCGPGQRVWLVERDGVMHCSAVVDNDAS